VALYHLALSTGKGQRRALSSGCMFPFLLLADFARLLLGYVFSSMFWDQNVQDTLMSLFVWPTSESEGSYKQ